MGPGDADRYRDRSHRDGHDQRDSGESLHDDEPAPFGGPIAPVRQGETELLVLRIIHMARVRIFRLRNMTLDHLYVGSTGDGLSPGDGRMPVQG